MKTYNEFQKASSIARATEGQQESEIHYYLLKVSGTDNCGNLTLTQWTARAWKIYKNSASTGQPFRAMYVR